MVLAPSQSQFFPGRVTSGLATPLTPIPHPQLKFDELKLGLYANWFPLFSINVGFGFKKKMVLGQLDIHMQKNEVRPLPYTIYKN